MAAVRFPQPMATAFCPANLSLVFETYEAEPPHDRGSLGIGITLERGVTASVEPSDGRDHRILVGGEEWDFPTVRSVLRDLQAPPVVVRISADFPFGCGFGMSGASALATALAASRTLGLSLSRTSLGRIAHRAEVANATGLGDVGGQINGGIMIRTRRHEPLSVDRLPVAPAPLHCRIFGPIRTADVITSPVMLTGINRAGREALEEVQTAVAADGSLTLHRLLTISRQFAGRSGLLRSPKVRDAIRECEAAGHAATMIMLGEAVVSTGPFTGSREETIRFTGASLLPGAAPGGL